MTRQRPHKRTSPKTGKKYPAGRALKDHIILPTKIYNIQQKEKWDKAILEWKKKKQPYPMPQVAFFYFFDKNGSLRETGYVVKYKVGGKWRGSAWGKTKKEALANSKRYQ